MLLQVILELSSKVSEQDDRIVELENILHEKNKEIERLQKQKDVSSPGDHVHKQSAQYSAAAAENSERVHVDTAADDDTSFARRSTEVSQRNTPTDWYGNSTFEQLSRQSTDASNTFIASSRSFPGRDVRKYGADRKHVDSTGYLQDSKSKPKLNNVHKLPTGKPVTTRLFHDKAQQSSVLSQENDSKQIVTSLRGRPGSGNTRYDADVSYCDSDLGTSDKSDDNESASTPTSVNRSSIRQISAQKMKKRGFLRSLVRNGDADSSDAGSIRHKPPVAGTRQTQDDDVDQLIDDIDKHLSVVPGAGNQVSLLEQQSVAT